MTTRFEHVNTYAAAPDVVLAMLTDKTFREEVCVRQQALQYDVRVDGSGAGGVVEIERSQSMEGAPSFATKISGDRVRVVQREHWRSDDRAEFELSIPGKPGHLKGTIRLTSNSDGGTDQVYTGEVKVGIPLVGGKLENLIEGILTRGLRREGRTGADWLARG